MKEVIVRTTISNKDLNPDGLKQVKAGEDFNGGRTLPFPDKMEEVAKWEADYAKLAKEKGWSTMPSPIEDMETGFRIRTGKEIRDKAREKFAIGEEKTTGGEKAPVVVGHNL